MDIDEFRVRGKEMVDYICRYLTTLPDKRVTPEVEPGYLRKLIPSTAPMDPESWDNIMKDVDQHVIPGMAHWQHPQFWAYFPTGPSFPSILGEMFSAGLNPFTFSWAASPVCTELETIVLDWLGKAIGLPEKFIASEEGSKGGGVIEGSSSECILVCMLAARANAIKRLKNQYPGEDEGVLLSKLIAYCSKEAHSCVEKAAMISFVKLRMLQPDKNSRLRGDTLKRAIEEDIDAGRVPFFVCATLGTTSVCSFDAIDEIGVVCKRFPDVWLHVDSAYAGSSFICPELKYLLNGIEYADSFNTSASKFLLVNFECACLWVCNKYLLSSALVVDPVYLQHQHENQTIDYRHWSIPLSRRFRSLKLWFVLRNYGISGLQKYIRLHCRLAKYFEALVVKDKRFEICNDVKLGLVCFRLKKSDDQSDEEINKINEKLLASVNASGKLYIVPARVRNNFIIRFCIRSENPKERDVDLAWKIITEHATELILQRKQNKSLKRTFLDGSDIYNLVLAKPNDLNRHVTLDFPTMDLEEFRQRGKQMIDYICKYYENLPKQKVYPDVEPGYLRKLLPDEAPETGEPWEKIMEDTTEHILKGLTHWQHPHFHAYFAHGATWPSLLGIMLGESFGVVPFSWTASPSCTELEVIVTDWLAKAYKLPEYFLHSSTGGGVIGFSASEHIMNCIIAARTRAVERLTGNSVGVHGSYFLPKLVAYCSEECHSSTEKAIKLAMIQLNILPTDEHNTLRGETLEKAIQRDIRHGLVPIFLGCSYGTTSTTAVDNFDELGPICKKYDMWMHIDAAYAGSALICPELRERVTGLEYADTININLSKWGLIHVDCALLYVKDKNTFCSSFIIDPLYLVDGNTNNLSYDLRHWGVPLSRRFRALKVWYMIRNYGLEKIRAYHRNHIKVAKYMASLLKADPLFKVMNDVDFGLVCFKLKDEEDETNVQLLRLINDGRELHMIPTLIKGEYAIRFALVNEHANEEHMDFAYKKIKEYALQALAPPSKKPVPQQPTFRASLDFTQEIPKSMAKFARQSLPDMITPIVLTKKN